MVADPAHHFPEFAESGADSVTFHVEAVSDPEGVGAAARAHGLSVGIAFNPATAPATAAAFAEAAGAELVLCMSIEPGYSGQPFMPASYARIAELAALVRVPIEVDGGIGMGNVAAVREAGATLLVAGNAVFADPDPGEAYRRIAAAAA
jgi:ribulose-phosphate 3-epimerase